MQISQDYVSGVRCLNQNPDKPERLATKPLRHKEKNYKKNFVPWCLGGEILLFDNPSQT